MQTTSKGRIVREIASIDFKGDYFIEGKIMQMLINDGFEVRVEEARNDIHMVIGEHLKVYRVDGIKEENVWVRC